MKTIHAEILAALRQDTPVCVDTRLLTAVDASVVQLLLAALKSAERQRRRLSIVAEPGDVFPATLHRLGMTSEFAG